MNDLNRPVDPRYWSWAATLGWSAAIALTFMIVQTLAIYLSMPPIDPKLSSDDAAKVLEKAAENGSLVAWAELVSAAAGCAAIAFVIQLRQGLRFVEYLDLRPIDRPTLIRWLIVAAIFVAAYDLLTLTLDRDVVPEIQTKLYITADSKWVLWLAVVIAAPVFEELLFRGFLFRGLMSSFLAKSGAILFTSILWALMHAQYDTYGIVQVAALGLVLGIARVKSQSLYVPIAMHMLNNFISMMETVMNGQ